MFERATMSEQPPVATEGGEPLSKNALKKKLKAERAAKLKAEKEAARVCNFKFYDHFSGRNNLPDYFAGFQNHPSYFLNHSSSCF